MQIFPPLLRRLGTTTDYLTSERTVQPSDTILHSLCTALLTALLAGSTNPLDQPTREAAKSPEECRGALLWCPHTDSFLTLRERCLEHQLQWPV